MLNITMTEAGVSRYQHLLLSEWGAKFPDEILDLLWSAVADNSNGAGDDPLFKLLDPAWNGDFPTLCFSEFVQSISVATKFTPTNDLPPLKNAYPTPARLSKPVWRAARLSAYLTLQAHVELDGELGFFQDLQALAFQAAIHRVLPRLQRKHELEHSILLHSLFLFPLEYYGSDPSHFSYLMSQLDGYLGRSEGQIRNLFASFCSTPPEDHSFLSKAQAFWTLLLEHERFHEAQEFLRFLLWWSLPVQRNEVMEMMVVAFECIPKNLRQEMAFK